LLFFLQYEVKRLALGRCAAMSAISESIGG
jgi:hypothetical protein